eukprot:Polyplicarium_translucidae@DN3309_c0_g2_i1.p3
MAAQGGESSRGTGEVVNLMAIDAQRLQDFAPSAAVLWSAPFQMVIAISMLYGQLGPSALGVRCPNRFSMVSQWCRNPVPMVSRQCRLHIASDSAAPTGAAYGEGREDQSHQ